MWGDLFFYWNNTPPHRFLIDMEFMRQARLVPHVDKEGGLLVNLPELKAIETIFNRQKN